MFKIICLQWMIYFHHTPSQENQIINKFFFANTIKTEIER
jgi:hypothetical protein